MGLTPLEGLMMASRSGSIDPGAIVAALRFGATADDVERDLDRASGLLAVGGSADLRDVLERARGGDDRARLAVAMFVDRAAAEIAAAATRVRRVDALVFTGGIGEGAAGVRRRIVGRLGALEPGPRVLVVRAREDLVIADAALRLVTPSGRGRSGGPATRSGRSGASRRTPRPGPGARGSASTGSS
jgi:acetate kinase